MSAPQPSWTTLFQNVIPNVQEIVRSEVHLAKVEIKEEAQEAAKAGVSLGIGLVVSVYSVGFILLCIVYALSLVLPSWLAALIVGVALGTTAFILVQTGWKKLRKVQPGPVKAIDSMKETAEWAKNQGK